MAYMPSRQTQDYLASWLGKAERYQISKCRDFNLTLEDFIQLWGDRRLKKLEAWVETGMADGRMRTDNPYAFVLGWADGRPQQVMNITTAKVQTRIQSELAGRFKRGDSHSPEARQRISNSKRGKKQSEAHKAKRSEAQKGSKRGPMSEEHKQAIRNAKAAKKAQLAAA